MDKHPNGQSKEESPITSLFSVQLLQQLWQKLVERFQKSFPEFNTLARSSKLQVSVTLVSDTWGQAKHLFYTTLHFILLTEEGKKLSTSQPGDGVPANMLLPSQFCAIFAAFTMGESVLQARGKTHLQPFQACEAGVGRQREPFAPCPLHH